MSDNPERLEKDWPQRWFNSRSPLTFTRMYLAGAIAMAALANLLAAIAVYHWHSRPAYNPFWWMTPFTLLVALNIPWLDSLISYRQIRKLAATTSVNSEMMQLVRHQTIRQTFFAYLAVGLIVLSFLAMLLQVQFGTLTR
jgi:hypothetical protein